MERKPGIDHIGQGDRKDQKSDRQQRHLQQRHTAHGECDANEGEDKSELRQQRKCGELADDMQKARNDDDQRPRPRWIADVGYQRLAPRPQQPGRDDGDQKSVAIFFLGGPPPQQCYEPAAKSDESDQKACRDKDGESNRARWR